MVWLGGVVGGSLLLLDEKQITRTVGSLHRIIHIVAFAGVTAGIWLLPSGPARKVASAGVFGFGMLTELAQSYYYENAYEWADVRDDGLGVLAAALLPVLLRVLYHRLRR